MPRVLVLLLLLGAAPAQPTVRPRLVVLISIDQLASWVFEDVLPHLAHQKEGGFNWLMTGGTWYRGAAYRHAWTSTGPGHATLSTGADPSAHGIVGNSWFDRGTGALRYCCLDPGAMGIGTATAAVDRGARALLAPTLGDTMKAHFGAASRVVSLSWKDRAAILMAGRSADLVAWMDKTNGSWVSSSRYCEALPDWLLAINRKRPLDGYFQKRWERGGPDTAFAGLVDERGFEYPSPGGGRRSFPYVIDGGVKIPSAPFYEHLYGSPFGNDILIQAAAAAIDGERLGQDDVPDMLCVSFSANDSVGHRYGPKSMEVRDIMLKTDRQLRGFFTMLEKKVGMEHCIVVLSSDHGVSPAPEPLVAAGVDAGRGELFLEAAQAANRVLTKRLGAPPPPSLRWVAGHDSAGLFLDHAAIAKRKLGLESVADLAATATGTSRGVRGAVNVVAMRKGRFLRRPWIGFVAAGLSGDRSPDVYVVLKPWWLSSTSAATHGSFYPYDREVPLLVWGAGRPALGKAGVSRARVSPGLGIVLAARALGIPPPPLASARIPAETR